jgi:hypothetical protein
MPELSVNILSDDVFDAFMECVEDFERKLSKGRDKGEVLDSLATRAIGSFAIRYKADPDTAMAEKWDPKTS